MTLYLPSTFATNTAFASAVAAASTASMSPLLPLPRLYQFAFIEETLSAGHMGWRVGHVGWHVGHVGWHQT